MAREIKFRGYNRKNKEWLYGFYVQNRGAHFVCPDEFAVNKSWDDYEIDPATLGQLTGLKDKSGKEIYEGDIVRSDLLPSRVYRVAFRNGLLIGAATDGGWIPLLDDKYYGDTLDIIEVIGNILDDPGATLTS